MNRRTFIGIVAFTSFAPPVGTLAQQGANVRSIGWLDLGAPPFTTSGPLEAFRRGLRELGWTEGTWPSKRVEAGGLISYSASVPDIFRRAAFLVDKILHGAKPVDLPVEQPTALELAINLKTAKAFGVTIPKTVLMRADEVIQ